MTTLEVILLVAVVALLIAVPVVSKLTLSRKMKQDAEKIGSAEEKARSIIDEAIKQAETKKRESMIEIQENSLRARNEVKKSLKSGEPRSASRKDASSPRKIPLTKRWMPWKNAKPTTHQKRQRCNGN